MRGSLSGKVVWRTVWPTKSLTNVVWAFRDESPSNTGPVGACSLLREMGVVEGVDALALPRPEGDGSAVELCVWEV
jgi:hypothetical protein